MITTWELKKTKNDEIDNIQVQDIILEKMLQKSIKLYFWFCFGESWMLEREIKRKRSNSPKPSWQDQTMREKLWESSFKKDDQRALERERETNYYVYRYIYIYIYISVAMQYIILYI